MHSDEHGGAPNKLLLHMLSLGLRQEGRRRRVEAQCGRRRDHQDGALPQGQVLQRTLAGDLSRRESLTMSTLYT